MLRGGIEIVVANIAHLAATLYYSMWRVTIMAMLCLCCYVPNKAREPNAMVNHNGVCPHGNCPSTMHANVDSSQPRTHRRLHKTGKHHHPMPRPTVAIPLLVPCAGVDADNVHHAGVV